MSRRAAARQHISGEQPEHVRGELTRNLLGQGDHSLIQRWYGKNKMLAEQARRLAETILNTPDADVPAKPRSALTKPGDPAALRGVPVVGGRGGFGGAIKGTQPLTEVLRRERRRQRAGDP